MFPRQDRARRRDRPRGPHDGWDESDPPQKWGVMRSQKEVRWGIPLFDHMTGRSRPHLSLREGFKVSHRPPV